ncbi:MAG: 30S ribosomal protein S2 [Candidatus Omnitrophica bacterium]|nr:30S ribosomal protein S2 [Candidatus Omnitrophota bacterium]
MTNELIKKLLEAGVHFGHQTKRWNPKMKPFIFGARSNIYIINLEKTAECLNQARDFLHTVAAKGGRILFVGTKKQAQEVTAQEAKRSDMFYMNYRWPGGLLTNFETSRKSLEKLFNIERILDNGVAAKLTKKEISLMQKEQAKLNRELCGIRTMKDLPQAMFVIDPKKEEIAVSEARKLNIPVVAIIDTNCDPDMVDYPIPANDDALKSIRLILSIIADSVLEGRQGYSTSIMAETKDKELDAQEAQSSEKVSK